MTEKNEYRGNVGQVIMGNATGPSVHVSMGKHDEKTFITSLQRNRIAAKVKELIVASGRKQLDIYGDILTEFGADNMDVFPRQKYKDTCAYLDALIERSKSASNPDKKFCLGCENIQIALRSAKMTNRILLSISVILLAGLSLLLFLKVNASPAAPAITLSACEHGKDRYTVGGIVENPDHSLMKCSVKDGSIYWQQIEAQSKKAFRAPAQKKYIPPADSD